MKKTILTILGWGLVIYIAVVGGMFANQRKMIYTPSLYEKADISKFKIPGIEEANVVTRDGLSIYGWFIPPKKKDGKVILRFHGNASNVHASMMSMIPYLKEGYGVLAAEYRGFSGNEGRPTEEGLYEDGYAFMRYLHARGYKDEDIIIYGESLGSGPAVQVALAFPRVKTLILHCPFSSMVEVGAHHYPYLPAKWIIQDKYDNLAKIRFVKASLILAHGTADSVVPYALGKKLYDAARKPKVMISIEGGNHNDLETFGLSRKVFMAIDELEAKR